MVLDVIEIRLAGNTLHNVPCNRRGIVGIGWCNSPRKNTRRDVRLHVIANRHQVIRAREPHILCCFFEPGRVRHDVAQRDGFAIGRRYLEIEIIIYVAIDDGGMGDIGYQNVSKVVLQNRPNVKILMLDTQVYSNTGGQNSDSSPMLGGGDMNTYGAATQGKNTEKKTVAETFLAGHGSPFVAQVSMANAPKLYRAILDGLEYRGTMFLQAFTTCQPEHGVADDMALFQAQRVRDSRGVPEFVFDPRQGETYQEALDIKGNPSIDLDWYETRNKLTGETSHYTVAHWCVTEARFRNHLKKIKPEAAAKLIPLDNMLVRITQQDVVYRRYLDPGHRAFIPDFGVFISYEENGKTEYRALSRQLVLFCVERRKSWRMLQSKAGIVNREYAAQRALLAEVDAGKLPLDELFTRGHELIQERLAGAEPVKA